MVHNDKIFIINDLNPQVYDPRENTWAKWPRPVKSVGEWPCLISWKDLIIILGGRNNNKFVQIFNSTMNTWSVLDAELSPFDLDTSACTLLPTNKILVVSSMDNALYDIETNSWDHEELEDLIYSRSGGFFINLNGRIFLFRGSVNVQEYIYNYKKWKELKVNPINERSFSSAIALPAELFADLLDGCEGVI